MQQILRSVMEMWNLENGIGFCARVNHKMNANLQLLQVGAVEELPEAPFPVQLLLNFATTG